MTDIPIIMSAPMILATLREVEQPGTGKTNTRRMLYSKRRAKNGIIPASVSFLQDHPPPLGRLGPEGFPTDIGADEYWTLTGWHKARAGDRLWVRESHWRLGRWIKMAALSSKAKWEFAPEHEGLTSVMFDEPAECFTRPHRIHDDLSWWKRPSIFLPMRLSRLTLIVTGTKIEKLQNISEDDARAEGVEPRVAGQDELGPLKRYRTGFVYLWGELHGTDSWLSNPDVVAIAFRPVLANIDAAEAQAA